MNIGLDIRELSVGSTGISQYTRNLLDFINYADSNNNYYLFANRQYTYSTAADTTAKIRTVISKLSNNTIFEQLLLPILLKNNKIDIFISPYYKLPLLSLSQVKKIITVHDIGFITFPIQYYGRTRFYRLFARHYLQLSLKAADHIFAVSEYTKSEILKYYKLPSNKISVLYNTVNEHFTSDAAANCSDIFREIVDRFGDYILSVSNFKPHKNIKNLLIAFAKLRNKTRWNLVLAGPMNRWSLEISRYAADCGLSDRVKFITPADNRELAYLYKTAKLYCHPSLHEGFGLPIIESQSCGCPVVSSDRTSLPEICGGSALFFNPDSPTDIADKIEALINNENLRYSLILKSADNVKRFAPAAVYKNLFEIFAKL